jgi:cell division protein FtsL
LVLLFRRYNDEVLYDVSMHVGHLLLGRLSQFDIRVVHDRFKNRYLFVKDDQLKLKRESKAEGSENANLIMSLERKEKSDSAERERIKKLTKNGEETNE